MRVSQRHLAGKRDSRRHSTAGFSENVAVALPSPCTAFSQSLSVNSFR